MTPPRLPPFIRAARTLAAQPSLAASGQAAMASTSGSGGPAGSGGSVGRAAAPSSAPGSGASAGSSPGGPPRVRFDDPAVAFAARSDTDLRVANLVLGTMAAPRWVTQVGVRVTRAALSAGVPGAEALVKGTVFRVFCGGATLEEVGHTVDALHRRGVSSILDYAVEGEKNEAGFEDAKEKLLETLRFAKTRSGVGFTALKFTALVDKDVLERAQVGRPLEGDAEALARGVARLETIVAEARRSSTPVFIDAEESWIQGAIDQHAERLMREHNRGARPIVFTTIQMYRKDGLSHLAALIDDARANGHRLGVKLVRGAYVEKEAARARDRGYENPLHPSKAETDRAYDEAVELCLAHLEHVELCAATHNQASVERLTAGMAARGLAPDDARITFAQLLGMSDQLTFPLAEAHFRSAKYVPFGPVLKVLEYLDRRAQENKETAGRGKDERALVVAELRRRRLAKKAVSSPGA